MKIIFAGTPDIAVPSLEALAPYVVAVLTNPDRPSGRGRKLQPSPVKEKALELGIPVLQPESLKQEARELVAAYEPELLVSFAYGKIFGPKFLSLFSKGGVNIHPSLLPLYRGPSPLNAALLAGDTETGISIQTLALEMDAGDILLQDRFELPADWMLEKLHDYVMEKSGHLIKQVIDDFDSYYEKRTVQDDSNAVYCSLIEKEAGLIDWNASAVDILNKVRAYTPWPGAYSFWEDKKLVIKQASLPNDSITAKNSENSAPGTVLNRTPEGILVQTGSGMLLIQELQLQGKKSLMYKDFLNGAHTFIGALLGGTQ